MSRHQKLVPRNLDLIIEVVLGRCGSLQLFFACGLLNGQATESRHAAVVGIDASFAVT